MVEFGARLAMDLALGVPDGDARRVDAVDRSAVVHPLEPPMVLGHV